VRALRVFCGVCELKQAPFLAVVLVGGVGEEGQRLADVEGRVCISTERGPRSSGGYHLDSTVENPLNRRVTIGADRDHEDRSRNFVLEAPS
jgi:hypothetical protein